MFQRITNSIKTWVGGSVGCIILKHVPHSCFVKVKQHYILCNARSWGSLLGMLPQGGTQIWGNDTMAPDDTMAMRLVGETYGCDLASIAPPPKAENARHESNAL